MKIYIYKNICSLRNKNVRKLPKSWIIYFTKFSKKTCYEGY